MAQFRLFATAAAPALDATPVHHFPSHDCARPADLSHHLNRTTLERKPSILKSLYKYFQIPGLLSLAGGLPFPGYFPYDTLEAAVCSSGRFPAKLVKLPAPSASPPPPPPRFKSGFLSFFRSSSADSAAVELPATHLEIPKFAPVGNPGSRVDVATTLQYTPVSGFPPLVEFIKGFALNHMHGGKIPYANPGILLTCGNTDGMARVVQMLAERGDNMLVEEYTYPNAVETAAPFGVGMAPVKIDHEGMIPSALQAVLANWDFRRRGRRPRFMYTVTLVSFPFQYRCVEC
jgi:DNA-binding transcriptional MocR family regulator